MFNINRAIAKTTPKQVKWAKIILAALAIILIGTDAFFAISDTDGFPTYSWLFKEKQAEMLWFTFSFGALTGKIFYNTFTGKNKEEVKGALIIGAIILGLVAIGNIKLFSSVPVWVELILFTGGILTAHFIWPQYKKTNPQT
jgi:hypothetical protein